MLDAENFGGVTDADRAKVAHTIYADLIDDGSAHLFDMRLAAIWNELCGALYHNAYFRDRTTISLVVDHLNAP